MKKLIILLAFIYTSHLYSQEVYLLRTIQSQQPFNIQKCNKNILYKSEDQKWVIKLRYDKNKNELFWSFYDVVYPPYENKSLFNNQRQEMLISKKDLQIENLTIEEVLNSSASASKIFSNNLNYQKQWNNGVSWSFIEPYEFTGDNIPTLSFKKTK